MLTFELNPILVREVRARWRKWPAFAVVFGFATLLAVVVWWRYAEFTAGYNNRLVTDTRGAQLGHELFVTLATTQVIGWMLLAPLLTTTGLLNERELGLLEAVQLSELTAKQIITGKLLSMLAFVVLMLLAPLPIIAVCFLLGGVSPLEYVAAMLFSLMTATTSGLIGLNCAAWNHQRYRVFAMTLGGLVAWATVPCGLIGHPLTMLLMLNADNESWMVYLLSILFYTGITMLVWRQAVHGLMRPLWLQRGEPPKTLLWYEPLYAIPLNPESPYAPPEPLVEASKKRQRRPLPLVSRLRFANPVLMHEVRRKLSIRRGGLRRLLSNEDTVALMGLCVVCLSPGIIVLYRDYNLQVYSCLTFLGLPAMLLRGAIDGAEAFAREREQQTWEGLRLTSLSRVEIAAGKFGAVLCTCFYFALPILIGLVCCCRCLSFYHSDSLFERDVISLPQILGAICIGASAVWCYTAFAMLISWLCQRTWIATAWTLALPILTLLAMVLGGDSYRSTSIGVAFQYCNPWAGFTNLNIAPTLHDAAIQVAYAAGAMLLLGSGFLIVLYVLMGREASARSRRNLFRHRLS